jgi:mannose-6-phosphate isomerase-like protein (cupin superfamily)
LWADKSRTEIAANERENMGKIAVAAVVALALGAPAMMLGQEKGNAAPAQQVTAQPVTPTPDKPFVFQGQQVQAQLAQLVEKAKATHHGDAELARTGNVALQLSVMAVSGPGELHRHADDVLMVQQGSATLITGGTMLNGKDRPNGNTYGSGLEGGESRTIGAGDIAIVPAGLTHQLVVPAGTVLVMIVGKIQEP